jgi:hypothetical protein
MSPLSDDSRERIDLPPPPPDDMNDTADGAPSNGVIAERLRSIQREQALFATEVRGALGALTRRLDPIVAERSGHEVAMAVLRRDLDSAHAKIREQGEKVEKLEERQAEFLTKLKTWSVALQLLAGLVAWLASHVRWPW